MRKLLFIGLFLSAILSNAQTPLTSNFFNYHLVDRSEILSGTISTDVFTGVKPFTREATANFTKNATGIGDVDSFNIHYLTLDNVLTSNSTNTSSRLGQALSRLGLYSTPAALYSVNTNDFGLAVNPILGFQYGSSSSDSLPYYRNTRGAELRGHIGKKVGFYTNVTENQFRFPDYLRQQQDSTGVVAGATLHKKFGEEGEDFFNVAGYITVSPIEQIQVQFGQDRNFIGNGYRSLILGDYATSYPFLKLNTKVWKINYQNLFMQHVDFEGIGERFRNPKKFSAFHHLSMNFGKNVTIGIFENIVFSRSDSTSTGNFEMAYLNPLIFYRAVEHGLNSSDNAILGMDWKWNFLNHFSFYGQLILDEFVKDEFFSGSDVYTNKWGYQAGLKYINVANVNNLDLQVEFNKVRPYVYGHKNKSQNWAHYNQAMAHPLGSNFRELIGIVRYQPTNRLNLNLTFIASKQGLDSSSVQSNFGGNISRPNTDILDRTNVTMFQGVENIVQSIAFTASYMAYHNLFIDAGVYNRSVSHEINGDNSSTIIHLGLRLNTELFKFE